MRSLSKAGVSWWVKCKRAGICMAATTVLLGTAVLWWLHWRFSCTAEDVCVFWHFSIRDQYSLNTPAHEGKEVHVSISFGVPLIGCSFCVSEFFLN